MKGFLKSLKRQNGFTLVELMVVVAIIGLLSAVAIPNFKKYQAKAKVSEAKLQLAGFYMAQSSFYSDFNTYAGCLIYMGFNPTGEIGTRFYAIGWTAAVVVPAAAHAAAVSSGLNATTCPATSTNAVGDFFPAGKGAGTSIANTQSTAFGGIATSLNGTGTGYVAAAGGVIDGSKITLASDTSVLTVNENKLIVPAPNREGY